MTKKISIAIATSAALTLILASNTIAQTNTPTLKVITPSENQTIYGDRIPILLAVDNFQLVDYQQYKTLKSGQGHIHVWLDEKNPTAEVARQIFTENTTYNDVPYGNHTLVAELVNNNHTSLKPPVVTTINFKSAPVATPSPASVSGFDKNTALVILVVVALVIVAAWWYTKEEEEETPTKSTSTTKRKTARKRRRS